jgi:hypothetical protein
MEKIIENKSLSSIIKSINLGLIDDDSIFNAKIVSDNHPDYLIKIIDCDLKQNVFDILQQDEMLKNNVKKLETNIFDFIIFYNNKETQTLMVNSVFEGFLFNQINLETEEWNLIK